MTNFLFNAHELPRRAGEFREYEISIDEHSAVGVALLAIPVDDPIHVELRLQAVSEGVLVSAEIHAMAFGECVRCLEPVRYEIDESFAELYNYESDTKHKKRGPQPVEVEVGDEDAELWMAGDIIDLESPIRDAVVLNMPINPLCSQECEGLCPGCGVKWSELPDGHQHAQSDIRWAGLENWSDPSA